MINAFQGVGNLGTTPTLQAVDCERNGNLQVANLEFIDDILSIVWEAGLLMVRE